MSLSKSSDIRWFCAAVLLLGLGLALQLSQQVCRAVFGRGDIMWTAIFASIPLSLCVASLAQSRRAKGLSLIVSATVCLMLWCVVWSNSRAEPDLELPETLRPVCFGVAAVASFACLIGASILPPLLQDGPKTHQARTGLLAVIMAFLLPLAYAGNVAETMQQQLSESLSAGRLKRSCDHAISLQALQPGAQVNGKRLDSLSVQLQEQVRRLESLLAQRSTELPIGQRVAALMQLDRDEEALATLIPLTYRADAPAVAYDYCGLCCQRLERWSESRDWYQKSESTWQPRPSSPQRTAALLSAWKGIAFAERKLDHPMAAREAYRQALSMEETAEIHFLLARLDEEQQHTSAARQHVARAIALAPQQYRAPGERLLRKMEFSHFSCLPELTR